MTPQAFEAASAGRTLHFSHLGQPFGSEQYLSGRRVLWRFADGGCQQGRWWDEGDQICFAYENGDGPQCWRFLPAPAASPPPSSRTAPTPASSSTSPRPTPARSTARAPTSAADYSSGPVGP